MAKGTASRARQKQALLRWGDGFDGEGLGHIGSRLEDRMTRFFTTARDGLDLRDPVRAVIHFDERADDGTVGHRRLPIERSAAKLHCDARGGPLSYRGPLSDEGNRRFRSFSAFSAARRFFSCLSRFGPFCFGTN